MIKLLVHYGYMGAMVLEILEGEDPWKDLIFESYEEICYGYHMERKGFYEIAIEPVPGDWCYQEVTVKSLPSFEDIRAILNKPSTFFDIVQQLVREL